VKQTKLSAGSNMHQIESLQNVSTEKRDENTNFDEVDSSEMQMHDEVNSVLFICLFSKYIFVKHIIIINICSTLCAISL
jgi:hypothetical protein